MESNQPPTSLEQARFVDDACDRFEASWKAGEGPRIEAYLSEAPGAFRACLLEALLAVEFELVCEQRGLPPLRRYQERFSEHADLVAAVYQQTAERKEAGKASPVLAETIVLARSPTDTSHDGTSVSLVAASPEPIGRFQILKVLGEGSFGSVYLAYDPKLDRQVALKVPRPGMLQATEERERFLREARSSAMLRHANICPTYEVDEVDGRHYLVMAYIQGQSLAARLKAQPLIPPDTAVRDVRSLALALAETHRKGVIHRDLKPANIMFDEERQELVIMDFGLARRMTANEIKLTYDGQILGTPAYMSPEQARGDNSVIGPASDIYSLGVILYEILAGRRPFEGSVVEVMLQIGKGVKQPPSAFNSHVARELDAICLKATALRMADRYATMADFADTLTQYLDRNSTTAENATAATPAPVSGAAEFDPYAAWLQIPANRRPPSHYDLLGLGERESDNERIRSAALDRMAAVRRYQLGTHSDAALRIISELSRAFDCLTDTQRKQIYDASLHPPAPPPIAEPQVELLAPVAVKYPVEATPTFPRPRSRPAATRRGLPVWPVAGGAGATVLIVLLAILAGGRDPRSEPQAPPSPPTLAPKHVSTHQESPPIVKNEVPQDQVSPPPAREQTAPNPTPKLPQPAVAAIAPFDASQALAFQEACAKQLGVAAATTNSLGMKLRLIPPGEFEMATGYTAVLTKPFRMGATEVAVEQFEAFVKETGYKTDAERSGIGGIYTKASKEPSTRRPENVWTNPTVAQGPDYPVGMLSWNDAVRFCQWLSEKEKTTYRLPTEAEWEWACRAGSRETFYFGADVQLMVDHAWIATNCEGATHPVAQKKPNAWGLFDLYGNVAEFCSDFYGSYPSGRVYDPKGPDTGIRHSIRSGAFFDPVSRFSSSTRYFGTHDLTYGHFGFRVVREEAVSQPPLPAQAAPAPQTPTAAFQWPHELLRQGRVSAPDLSNAKVLLREEFDNPNSGFEKAAAPNGSREAYSDGKYFITQPSRSFRRAHRRENPTGWGESAYEVVARVTGDRSDFWELQINRFQQKLGVSLRIRNNGFIEVWPGATDVFPDGLHGPVMKSQFHAAIKQGGQPNTLLAILRRGWMEIYVNGKAVCDPLAINPDFDPNRIQFCLSTSDAGEAEFERLMIYSAAGLPTPQQRLRADGTLK